MSRTVYDPENDPSVLENERRDVQPPVSDDLDTGPRRQEYDHRSPNERDDDDEDGRAVPPRPSVHDSRNAIYARRNEERKAQFEGEDEAETLIWPKGMAPEDNVDEPENKPPVKRKLKVYGEELERTDEEVIALAQKQLASENKFEDYKALEARLRLAESALARQSQPQDEVDPDDARAAEAQTRAEEERAERRRRAVEAIQTGDVDEGLEGLESILNETRMSREEIAALAREQAQLMRDTERAQEERQRVLQSYAEEFPEIVNDRAMTYAVATQIHEDLVKEMERIGTAPEFIDQARRDPAVAKRYHDDLRGQGFKLSPSEEVVRRNTIAVYDHYKIPRTPRENAQPERADQRDTRSARREEKRNLTPEPNRATADRRPRTEAPASREDAITKMRRLRGQPV